MSRTSWLSGAPILEQEWHEEEPTDPAPPVSKIIGYRGQPPHFNDADFGVIAIDDAHEAAIIVPSVESST